MYNPLRPRDTLEYRPSLSVPPEQASNGGAQSKDRVGGCPARLLLEAPHGVLQQGHRSGGPHRRPGGSPRLLARW